MHEWINETIVERFRLLSGNAEQLEEVKVLRARTREAEQQLLANMPHEREHLDNLLNLLTELDTLHNKHFYAKGLQDGIQLLIFFLFDDGILESNK
ncbi:hypothetical protein [Paenibacillus flagellatus]|uniref:Uncharacterized protein n=1 Tax=Paenibacillus flagellatus TaxID=2211139 RepID=A0A2V5JXB7_9BACL|nr:hypothetical protein [Paenibacillus flagellatus]PYI51479.1 hypothetical protein DLM86_23925 [Paenibacillus flagellatus]